MNDKRSVTVNIYGNEYTLKGDADPAYIADLARYVDTKMNEIGKKSGAPAAKVAILAAMNISDELHRLEKVKFDVQRMFETSEKALLEMKQASDGSIKHTVDLKSQADKAQGEAHQMKEKMESLEKEIAQLRETETALKDSETKAKELAGINLSKIESMALEMGEARKELEILKPETSSLRKKIEETEISSTGSKQELEDRVSALKSDLEASRARTAEAEKKADSSIEESRLKLEEQNEKLEEATATVEKLKVEFEKILKESSEQGPSFLPNDGDLKSLFQRIDAVIET